MSFFNKKISKPDSTIKLGDYDPGNIDPTTGREMVYICYQTSEFLVSIDKDMNLNWFGGDNLKYADDFGEVVSQVNLTEALVDRIFVGRKNRMAYKRMLGDVLSTLLDDENSKTARQMMEEVKNRVLLHSKERIRMSYINTAVFSVAGIGILILLTILFRTEILQCVNNDRAIYRVLVCTLLGGIGAFITTFARFKDYQGSIISGLPIHRLDGFLRVFYGLVAGLIISLAIKSKILVGFVADDDQPWLLYFFAMIAGASEALIPNLVKEAEKTSIAPPQPPTPPKQPPIVDAIVPTPTNQTTTTPPTPPTPPVINTTVINADIQGDVPETDDDTSTAGDGTGTEEPGAPVDDTKNQ